MRLFEFTPEIIKLIETIVVVVFIAALVIASVWYEYKARRSERERKIADIVAKDMAKNLRGNMNEYAQLRNENTALLRRIKELEARIKRTDQPRERGRFSVKKVDGSNPNIGKYECLTENMTFFDLGKFYERYNNDSGSLILIGNNRMRRNVSHIRQLFRLVKA